MQVFLHLLSRVSTLVHHCPLDKKKQLLQMSWNLSGTSARILSSNHKVKTRDQLREALWYLIDFHGHQTSICFGLLYDPTGLICVKILFGVLPSYSKYNGSWTSIFVPTQSCLMLENCFVDLRFKTENRLQVELSWATFSQRPNFAAAFFLLICFTIYFIWTKTYLKK